MDIRHILGLSILLQLGAAAIALWLIRITGRRLAWVLIAVGVTLMAVRRAITWTHLRGGEFSHPFDFSAELVALATSFLMFVGLALLIPLFRSARDSVREAHEGETRFRRLIEAAFDGICIHDGKRILDANAAFAAMFGYADSAVIGVSPVDLAAPDARDLAAKTVRSGSRERHEVNALRKDGSIFRVEVCSKPAMFQGKEVRVVALRDVTERRRAEEAMRASEARYRAVTEQANDLICEVDDQGRFVYVSPNLREVLGWDPVDFMATSSFDWIHVDDVPTARSKLAEAFKTGAGDLVMRARDASGLWHWFECRGRRYETASGEPCVVVISRDVTERRHAEEALRNAHDELETRVQERTVELLAANESLRREMAERRRMEEALRHSEQEYRALFQNAQIAIYRSKIDGSGMLAANRKLGELLGCSMEELMAEPATLRWSDPKAREDMVRLVQDKGALTDYEIDIVTKRGDVRTCLTSIKLDAEHGYLEGTSLDITDRKRMERDLRESEERFRTVVGASNDAMIAVGEEALITLFNPAAERMFGWSAGEMLGQPLDALIPDEFRAQHQDYLQQYFRHGEPSGAIGRTLELPAVRRDGRRFPIGLSLSTGRHGGRRFALAVIRDITDTKRAEEALMTRLRYEEALAACSQALLGDIDREEALSDTLSHLLRGSGVSRVYIFENFDDPDDGLCMRQVLELCAPDVRPEIDNPLLQHLPYRHGFDRWREQLAKGEAAGGVVADLTPAEQEVLRPQDIVSILCLPIFTEGEWYGFIGFDDTRNPRTWTQEDVRLLRTAAEMIGAFIGRGRSEERLRQAKEDAEAASRAKSVFLANMSHEIRTPITAMLAAAELLGQRYPDRSDVPEHLDMIFTNGRHLLALVDDLLDLSRTEAGKLEVRRTACFLGDILADVQAVTELFHTRETVDFQILYETAIPTAIDTDPTRLKQAVINLVSNALKFTKAGHVYVRVAVYGDRPEPRLSIAVEDTGVGIPADKTVHIFETFAQIEPGSSGVFGGVGLGLPLARWIAEELGGGVEVTSELGRGSTFMLRVATGPLDGTKWIRPDYVSIPARPRPGAGKPNKDRPLLQGCVLLAEDFSDTRRLIEEALTGRGVTVIAVGNGEDAVREAQSQSFDLILMDIRMPGMGGLAATEVLRRQGCVTPVIALTASTSERDRERILAGGFDDFWKKPISLERLVEAVADYLPAAPGESPTPPGESTASSHVGGPADRTKPTLDERLAEARAEFVHHLPQRLARIMTAVQTGDMREAREALHQLVGAGGIHGFMPLSTEAARLLDLAKRGTLADHPDELQPLAALIERAVNAVRKAADGTDSAA